MKQHKKTPKGPQPMKKKAPKLTDQQRLEGAKFRILNEKLYTTTSEEAQDLFSKKPGEFDLMHKGFATQAQTWPIVPVDEVIKWLQDKFQPPCVIADMGCGDAKISASLPNTVHSFDFKAKNSRVVECDMSHTPLESRCVDVVVFVLSLMGTNLSDFIREARRILKIGGKLLIVEVTSRIDDRSTFIRAVESYGFKSTKQKNLTNFFTWIEFTTDTVLDFQFELSLKPCIYKRR